MSASAGRRHRKVAGAVVAIVVGLVAAGVLGNAGRVAILNTTDGELASSGIPEDRFPRTPITALAVTGDDGALASVAVFVAAPADDEGVSPGGTLVVVPATADASNGFGDQRYPLAGSFADGESAAGGAARLTVELPLLLGVSVDSVVVVDAERLAAGLADAGVADSAAVADTLATVAPAGTPAVTGYPEQVAAWRRAVEQRESAPVSSPAGASDEWSALFAGEVSVAALGTRLPDLSMPTNGADIALLDRAEVVTLFGHLAPANLAAPNAGFNFRVVSPFADDQLDGSPLATRYDAAYVAVAELLGADYNVLSVDATAGDTAAATRVEVSDEALVDGAASLESLFGPVEVVVAERRIAGVDVVVVLGTDFLPLAAADVAAVESVPSGSVGATVAGSPAPTAGIDDD